MGKYLSLMHDTAGKTNRIKKRVDEMIKHLEENHPEVLTTKLSANESLDGSFFLRDIKNQAIALDEELDAFYVANKHEDD